MPLPETEDATTNPELAVPPPTGEHFVEPGDLCGLEAVDAEMIGLENFFKKEHLSSEAGNVVRQMIKRIRDLETDKDFMKRAAEDSLITICSR